MDRIRFSIRTALVALALLLAFALTAAWQQSRVLKAHDTHAREQLRVAQRMVEAQHRDVLHARAELVAGDPAFAGYVEQAMGGVLPGIEVDTTSIIDLLRERQNQLGLTAAAVLDRNGRVIASTADLAASGSLQDDALFQRAQADLAVASGVRAHGEGLLHLAMLPLAAVGVSEGFLLVGMPLDLAFAQDIADASGGDVLVQANVDGRIVASTFDGTRASASPVLAQAARFDGARITLDGSDRPVTALPLFGSDHARLVLLAPAAPREALAGALRTAWFALAVVLLVALGAAAIGLWRRVLRPVSAVVDCLDRASAGDYRLRVPDTVAGSMAPLVLAFNRLMGRLGT